MNKTKPITYLFMFLIVLSLIYAECPDDCPQEQPQFDANNPTTWKNDINKLNELDIDILTGSLEAIQAVKDNWDKFTKKEEVFERNFGEFKDKAKEYFESKTPGKNIEGIDTVNGITYSNGILKYGDTELNLKSFSSQSEFISVKAIDGKFIFSGRNNNNLEISAGQPVFNLDGTININNQIISFSSNSGQSIQVYNDKIILSNGATLKNSEMIITAQSDGVIIEKKNGDILITGKSIGEIKNFNNVRIGFENREGTLSLKKDQSIMFDNAIVKYNLDYKSIISNGIEVTTPQIVINGKGSFDKDGIALIKSYPGAHTIFQDYMNNIKIKTTTDESLLIVPKGKDISNYNKFDAFVTYGSNSFSAFGAADVEQGRFGNKPLFSYKSSEGKIIDNEKFIKTYNLMIKDLDSSKFDFKKYDFGVPYLIHAHNYDYGQGKFEFKDARSMGYLGLKDYTTLKRDILGVKENVIIDANTDKSKITTKENLAEITKNVEILTTGKGVDKYGRVIQLDAKTYGKRFYDKIEDISLKSIITIDNSEINIQFNKEGVNLLSNNVKNGKLIYSLTDFNLVAGENGNHLSIKPDFTIDYFSKDNKELNIISPSQELKKIGYSILDTNKKLEILNQKISESEGKEKKELVKLKDYLTLSLYKNNIVDLKQFISDNSKSEFVDYANMQIGEYYQKEGNIKKSKETYLNLIKNSKDDQVKSDANLLMATIAINEGNGIEALNYARASSQFSDKELQADKIVLALEQKYAAKINVLVTNNMQIVSREYLNSLPSDKLWSIAPFQVVGLGMGYYKDKESIVNAMLDHLDKQNKGLNYINELNQKGYSLSRVNELTNSELKTIFPNRDSSEIKQKITYAIQENQNLKNLLNGKLTSLDPNADGFNLDGIRKNYVDTAISLGNMEHLAWLVPSATVGGVPLAVKTLGGIGALSKLVVGAKNYEIITGVVTGLGETVASSRMGTILTSARTTSVPFLDKTISFTAELSMPVIAAEACQGCPIILQNSIMEIAASKSPLIGARNLLVSEEKVVAQQVRFASQEERTIWVQGMKEKGITVETISDDLYKINGETFHLPSGRTPDLKLINGEKITNSVTLDRATIDALQTESALVSLERNVELKIAEKGISETEKFTNIVPDTTSNLMFNTESTFSNTLITGCAVGCDHVLNGIKTKLSDADSLLKSDPEKGRLAMSDALKFSEESILTGTVDATKVDMLRQNIVVGYNKLATQFEREGNILQAANSYSEMANYLTSIGKNSEAARYNLMSEALSNNYWNSVESSLSSSLKNDEFFSNLKVIGTSSNRQVMEANGELFFMKSTLKGDWEAPILEELSTKFSDKLNIMGQEAHVVLYNNEPVVVSKLLSETPKDLSQISVSQIDNIAELREQSVIQTLLGNQDIGGNIVFTKLLDESGKPVLNKLGEEVYKGVYIDAGAGGLSSLSQQRSMGSLVSSSLPEELKQGAKFADFDKTILKIESKFTDEYITKLADDFKARGLITDSQKSQMVDTLRYRRDQLWGAYSSNYH